VAKDAPQQAVLRVLAPEGEPYDIQWGGGFSKEDLEGEVVDPKLGYRDYPVRDEAVSRGPSEGFDIKIEASGGKPGGYRQEVPLGTVLFVEGEYAECHGGTGNIYIFWKGHKDFGPTMTRMLCGSHRYAPL
jgi:hypothetical protein